MSENPFVTALKKRMALSNDPLIAAAIDEIERLSEEIQTLASDNERLMEELEKCWKGT